MHYQKRSMQGNLLIKTVVFGISLVAVFSCSSKKTSISTSVDKEKMSRIERLQILRQIEAHQLRFNTFSGRAKSKLVVNRENYDVTANVRIERDKAIWISVTALMGIEAGRILITPDSVKIINRLQAEYINKPFEYLYKFASEDLDFSSLQQLLVGNVIQETFTKNSEIWMNERGYSLRGQHNDLLYLAQLDTGYRPVVTVLDDAIRNQRMEASYEEYRSLAGQVFPNQVKISVMSEELRLQSEMRYNRVVYDGALDMPFNIPARYKEIQ